jgi:flagellin
MSASCQKSSLSYQTLHNFLLLTLKVLLLRPLINITAQPVAEKRAFKASVNARRITMSVINTNITSMIGQSNLAKSQNALQTSMERLSSGLRINSAKDDAAGQAIANRMSAQVTGLAQAQRNANDGISVAQTAEGALNQVNDNLQRIRELSVQAQNGTNSAEDKQSIQDEINQRLDEIDRISEETNFNGVAVLNTNEDVQIQVGANDGETISVDLEQINRSTLGMSGFSVGGTTGALTEIVANDGARTPIDLSAAETALGGDLEIVGYGAFDEPSGTYANYALEDVDGNRYELTSASSGATAGGNDQIVLDTDTGTVAVSGTFDADTFKAAGETAYQTAVDNEIASTANPLKAIDDALNKVDNLRSGLGAVQNRFESAITNLQTNETNLSAARSRIEDADYATEVANMTRAQILQQAGTSVLAQANQIPQNVLSLLG